MKCFSRSNKRSKEEEKVVQRASDLAELGIEIELFAVTDDSNSFSVGRFYQDIISYAEDDEVCLRRMCVRECSLSS